MNVQIEREISVQIAKKIYSHSDADGGNGTYYTQNGIYVVLLLLVCIALLVKHEERTIKLCFQQQIKYLCRAHQDYYTCTIYYHIVAYMHSLMAWYMSQNVVRPAVCAEVSTSEKLQTFPGTGSCGCCCCDNDIEYRVLLANGHHRLLSPMTNCSTVSRVQ